MVFAPLFSCVFWDAAAAVQALASRTHEQDVSFLK